jgi:hypothetical protein
MNNQNIVLISRAELDTFKLWDFDRVIKYLIKAYGDRIKTALVEGFTFKVEGD